MDCVALVKYNKVFIAFDGVFNGYKYYYLNIDNLLYRYYCKNNFTSLIEVSIQRDEYSRLRYDFKRFVGKLSVNIPMDKDNPSKTLDRFFKLLLLK